MRAIAAGQRSALGLSLPVYAAARASTSIAAASPVADVVLGAMTLPAPLRPLSIVGYAALVMLLMHRRRLADDATRRDGPDGAHQLSRHQAVCMTAIFYGYGLGCSGDCLARQLYLVVAGGLGAMLLWSKPWLDRFATARSSGCGARSSAPGSSRCAIGGEPTIANDTQLGLRVTRISATQ